MSVLLETRCPTTLPKKLPVFFENRILGALMEPILHHWYPQPNYTDVELMAERQSRALQPFWDYLKVPYTTNRTIILIFSYFDQTNNP